MSDFPYRVALLREEQLKNTLYVSSSKFGPQTSKANHLSENRDRSRGGDHISARLERTVRLSDQLDITGVGLSDETSDGGQIQIKMKFTPCLERSDSLASNFETLTYSDYTDTYLLRKKTSTI